MTNGSVPCRSCGRPVPADSRSCPSCGAPVDGSEPRADVGQGRTPGTIVDAEAADGITSGGIVPNPAVPGSYLRPATVYRPSDADTRRPTVMPLAGSSPPMSDASPGVTTSGVSDSAEVPTPRRGAAPTGSPAAPHPGSAPLLADLPFDAPTSPAGWLVALGSGVGALSFLLPWAPNVVGYTSSWGLASPANLPILGLLLATAVLEILPNRVATWVRSGVLGLIGGALFLGLLWPFIVGDFGADFGSLVGAGAALVLIAGGILSVAPEHDRPSVV